MSIGRLDPKAAKRGRESTARLTFKRTGKTIDFKQNTKLRLCRCEDRQVHDREGSCIRCGKPIRAPRLTT